MQGFTHDTTPPRLDKIDAIAGTLQRDGIDGFLAAREDAAVDRVLPVVTGPTLTVREARMRNRRHHEHEERGEFEAAARWQQD